MVEHTTHNRVVGGSNPPTATSRLEPAIEYLPKGGRVLVALSGGPDSTALLISLKELGVDLVAAHFDHALRAGSELDAMHVANLCAGLGVDLITGRREQPLPAGSLQAAARKLRHGFLEEARASSGAQVVALGHTADDFVEGVLLHLLRGSALAGLRGMPATRGAIVRPLLRIWRRDIEDFLAGRQVRPLRDPSNEDLRHARVRVRLELLPRLERDAPGISRRLSLVAQRAAVMQADLAERAGALVHDGRVNLVELGEASEAIRLEALKELFVSAGGAQPGLDRRALARMDRLGICGSAGDGLDLPGGLRVRRLYGEMEVTRAVGMSPPRVTIVRWMCAGCDSLQAAHLRPGARLTLGKRAAGLRMRPFPDRGSRKLQDILVDAKVPRHRRDELDLVFADGQLAWVPGIAVDARWVASKGTAADHVEVRGVPKGLC